jgi:hypothetical protein
MDAELWFVVAKVVAAAVVGNALLLALDWRRKVTLDPGYCSCILDSRSLSLTPQRSLTMNHSKPDFLVVNHFSLVTVTPLTPAAEAWVEENVPLEDWQYIGRGFVVEPRYVGNLVDGIQADGLTIR